MTSFRDQMRAETALRINAFGETFVRAVQLTTESIVEGSPITGAPGQPVRTGNLKASWQTSFESPLSARISTNVEYALPIEEGVGRFGPLTLRSAVGGFGSVKLTVANFDRVVEQAKRETTDVAEAAD
jgi:hypothetical protein